jgi:hypothetical protein
MVGMGFEAPLGRGRKYGTGKFWIRLAQSKGLSSAGGGSRECFEGVCWDGFWRSREIEIEDDYAENGNG